MLFVASQVGLSKNCASLNGCKIAYGTLSVSGAIIAGQLLLG